MQKSVLCLDLKLNWLSAVVNNCSQRKKIKDSITFDITFPTAIGLYNIVLNLLAFYLKIDYLIVFLDF